MLRQKIKQLRDALIALKDSKESSKTSILDFKSQQHTALKTTITTATLAIEKELETLEIPASKHLDVLKSSNSIAEKLAALEEISQAISEAPENNDGIKIGIINLPFDVKDEINADINELKKCFDSGCFRSAVILCGRILETALHRKYFEVAGNDLLEKSPGMGLGNLLARMEEKGISLDPGLTNQIHLINQVRIYSVHKKQQPFYPTKTQSQAIILYTTDVLKKLFENR